MSNSTATPRRSDWSSRYETSVNTGHVVINRPAKPRANCTARPWSTSPAWISANIGPVSARMFRGNDSTNQCLCPCRSVPRSERPFNCADVFSRSVIEALRPARLAANFVQIEQVHGHWCSTGLRGWNSTTSPRIFKNEPRSIRRTGYFASFLAFKYHSSICSPFQ